MSKTFHALCWAVAVIFVAGAGATQLIGDDLARTMVGIMPALAVLSLTGTKSCFRLRGGA